MGTPALVGQALAMELYFAPLSGSFTARVVAREAGIAHTLHQVEVHTKTLTATGASYLDIVPFGQVPALRFADGSILTETTAVLQYLADLNPDSGLAPSPGTAERYRFLEWLGFIATEIHKKILWPLFNHRVPDQVRHFARASAPRAFSHVARALGERDVLVGDRFTAADAYLVWALHLASIAGLDPGLSSYSRTHRARGSIRDLLAEETPLALAAHARQPEP